jgi:micrococcal nuclease
VVRDNYTRAATVVEVVDGDTVRLDVDLGFYVRVRMLCRLVGLNAPEHNQPGGPQATAALAALVASGAVTVVSVTADKYAGRFDAEMLVTTPTSGAHVETVVHVNRWLIDHGFAVAWDGTGARPLVPWPNLAHQEGAS